MYFFIVFYLRPCYNGVAFLFFDWCPVWFGRSPGFLFCPGTRIFQLIVIRFLMSSLA
nr:MAG TPA_asm: hypothetical protein [Caudoviricetes sp.]